MSLYEKIRREASAKMVEKFANFFKAMFYWSSL